MLRKPYIWLLYMSIVCASSLLKASTQEESKKQQHLLEAINHCKEETKLFLSDSLYKQIGDLIENPNIIHVNNNHTCIEYLALLQTVIANINHKRQLLSKSNATSDQDKLVRIQKLLQALKAWRLFVKNSRVKKLLGKKIERIPSVVIKKLEKNQPLDNNERLHILNVFDEKESGILKEAEHILETSRSILHRSALLKKNLEELEKKQGEVHLDDIYKGLEDTKNLSEIWDSESERGFIRLFVKNGFTAGTKRYENNTFPIVLKELEAGYIPADADITTFAGRFSPSAYLAVYQIIKQSEAWYPHRATILCVWLDKIKDRAAKNHCFAWLDRNENEAYKDRFGIAIHSWLLKELAEVAPDKAAEKSNILFAWVKQAISELENATTIEPLHMEILVYNTKLLCKVAQINDTERELIQRVVALLFTKKSTEPGVTFQAVQALIPEVWPYVHSKEFMTMENIATFCKHWGLPSPNKNVKIDDTTFLQWIMKTPDFNPYVAFICRAWGDAITLFYLYQDAIQLNPAGYTNDTGGKYFPFFKELSVRDKNLARDIINNILPSYTWYNAGSEHYVDFLAHLEKGAFKHDNNLGHIVQEAIQANHQKKAFKQSILTYSKLPLALVPMIERLAVLIKYRANVKKAGIKPSVKKMMRIMVPKRTKLLAVVAAGGAYCAYKVYKKKTAQAQPTPVGNSRAPLRWLLYCLLLLGVLGIGFFLYKRRK